MMPWALDTITGRVVGKKDYDYQWSVDFSGLTGAVLERYLEREYNQKDPFARADEQFWIKRFVSRDFARITTPVPPEIVPLGLTQHNGPRDYPDFFHLLSSVVVSKRCKLMIEEFEPGIHQFIEISVTDATGEARTGDIFLLKIGNVISDGILPEKSDVSVHMDEGKPALYQRSAEPPRITWNSDRIANRHLWVDALMTNQVTVSDALKDAMFDAGFEGFQAQEAHAE